MLPILFVGMLWAVAPGWSQVPDDIGRVADEIHQIAQAEPLLSGLKTRLQLAEYFKERDPSRARRYLAESVQHFGAIDDSDLITEPGAKVVKLYLEAAPNEAENAARALPGRSRPEGLNAREAAYDVIIDHFRTVDRGKAGQLLLSAFGAGAFRLYAGQQMLHSLMKDDVQRGHELFGQFVIAFPVTRADSRDMLFFLDLARPVFKTNAALASQALEKVLEAVDRRGFEEESTRALTTRYQVGTKEYSFRGRRESVLFQVAAFLKAYQPDVYHANAERFRPFDEPLETVTSGETASAVELIGTSYASKTGDGAPARGDVFISRVRDLHRKAFPEALQAIEGTLDPELRVRLLSSLLSGGRGTKEERRGAALKLIGWTQDVKDDAVRADCLTTLITRFSSPEDSEIAERALAQLNPVLGSLCHCQGAKPKDSGAAECREGIGHPRCPSICEKVAEYLHAHKLVPDAKTDLSVKAQYLLIGLRQKK